jgi:hypothetical protein
MAIYIDMTTGGDAQAFDDLLQIARCDPGLTTWHRSDWGSGGGLNPSFVEVQYQQKLLGVTSSNLLLSVVKSEKLVWIAGVGPHFVLPTGNEMILYGGFSWAATPSDPVTIFYDVTAANGYGYYTLDKDDEEIDFPLPVILYHELAHAYHRILGDAPGDHDLNEVQAMTDENAFRSQVGLPLRGTHRYSGGVRVRAPTTDPFPRCDAPKGSWGLGRLCLVATAATGSQHSPQVAALRRARSEYRDLSLWTSLVAGPMLDAYRQFSPNIVRAMDDDPALKDAVLTYAIQPAFHLVKLVEAYLEANADTSELLAHIDLSLTEYASEVEQAGGTAETLSVAAEEAISASRYLRNELTLPTCHFVWPRDLYRYLATAITSSGVQNSGFAWALEGVELILRQGADRLWGKGTVPLSFARELGAWLARFPISADAPLSIPVAREELKVLRDRVYTRDYTQELFAQHLLARWPEPHREDLCELLKDLDFVKEDH